jgi:hypothetical protein
MSAIGYNQSIGSSVEDYTAPTMAIVIAPEQEIWVMTTEGAELTGYNRYYLEKLANKNSKLPEDERQIKVRKRLGRHELWLPDLLRYIDEIGYGPHQDK